MQGTSVLWQAGFWIGSVVAATSLVELCQPVADMYRLAVVSWTTSTRLTSPNGSDLINFMSRVAARPKVQDAMRAEGLMKWFKNDPQLSSCYATDESSVHFFVG